MTKRISYLKDAQGAVTVSDMSAQFLCPGKIPAPHLRDYINTTNKPRDALK